MPFPPADGKPALESHLKYDAGAIGGLDRSSGIALLQAHRLLTQTTASLHPRRTDQIRGDVTLSLTGMREPESRPCAADAGGSGRLRAGGLCDPAKLCVSRTAALRHRARLGDAVFDARMAADRTPFPPAVILATERLFHRGPLVAASGLN